MIYIVSLFLFSNSIFANETKKKIIIKSKPISALILFMGDYKNQLQFDGPVQQSIAGIYTEAKDLIADKDCEITAQFQEVLFLNSRHLKINFAAECITDGQKQKIKLTPEYVRLKDLKTHSSSFYLSEKHKNVQFKIVDLKY